MVLDSGIALRQTCRVFFRCVLDVGKIILLAVAFLILCWVVRSSLRRRTRNDASPPASEDMVRCAECGVHLPRGESLVVRGEFFCCAEHQHKRQSCG